MTATEAFETLASSLIGVPLSHLWRGHGSAVFLELGQLTPPTRRRRDGSLVNPEGEVSLGVEWSWRIEDPRSILCGSGSDEDLWEVHFARLRGAHVVRCELFGSLPEVALTLSTDLRFLSFSTTAGQPRWHIIDRRHGPARWFTVEQGRLHLGDGSEPAFR